jgi:hypothetical protein
MKCVPALKEIQLGLISRTKSLCPKEHENQPHFKINRVMLMVEQPEPVQTNPSYIFVSRLLFTVLTPYTSTMIIQNQG